MVLSLQIRATEWLPPADIRRTRRGGGGEAVVASTSCMIVLHSKQFHTSKTLCLSLCIQSGGDVVES